MLDKRSRGVFGGERDLYLGGVFRIIHIDICVIDQLVLIDNYRVHVMIRALLYILIVDPESSIGGSEGIDKEINDGIRWSKRHVIFISFRSNRLAKGNKCNLLCVRTKSQLDPGERRRQTYCICRDFLFKILICPQICFVAIKGGGSGIVSPHLRWLFRAKSSNIAKTGNSFGRTHLIVR